MKKDLLILCFVFIFLGIGLVVAQNGSGNGFDDGNVSYNENVSGIDDMGRGLGSMVRNRVKAGVYINEAGDQIRVSELAQNRTRLRIREIDVESELEIEELRENNRTRLRVKLSNGRDAEIKIMPDRASETALARLRLKVCNESNNCSFELKEVGSKLAYELRAEKKARIFGLFRTRMRVESQIDAESGEIIMSKKPWWAFLASESDE